MTDLEHLPAFLPNGHVNAVIEIPSGTSDKRQYDPATGTFPVDLRNGVPRRIKFLPYPANYGFIPSTLMDKAQGGDGDALDIFVLCAGVPSGTVLEVEPIGIIELLDANERDDKDRPSRGPGAAHRGGHGHGPFAQGCTGHSGGLAVELRPRGWRTISRRERARGSDGGDMEMGSTVTARNDAGPRKGDPASVMD